MEAATIRFIEELSLNAWPALRTSLLDGWLLRMAGGYTRRANSVQPLYPSNLPTAEKVAYCEEAYRLAGLPTIFKLTDAAEPAELDGFLADRGYRREAETSVQLLDIADLRPTDATGVYLQHQATLEWCTALAALTDVDTRHVSTMHTMLGSLMPPAAFASVVVDGRVVATGMAVAERECVGLFDMAVNQEYRRQGLGTAVLCALCRWAAETHGAQTAYLQVVADNAPALALYRRLGFLPAYGYWYRVQADS